MSSLQLQDEDDSSDEEASEEEITDVPSKRLSPSTTEQRVVFLLGVLSCSMLIGDGVVTPPNSVLGALNSPIMTVPKSWNVVIAVLIQIGLFALQRAGSRVIGFEMARYMAQGFNPAKVYEWFIGGHFHGVRAYRSIAGIVLCVTGAEALYADMGHFGPRPITTAWFTLVFPCLILQYMGQAIVLANDPKGVSDNPLYLTAPNHDFLWPLFLLAALAAVIASQALISGIFTLMSQAHALGLVPRLLVLHTNPDERGQVYIPEINWMLMTGCIMITLAFETSDALVAAYGIAVTGAFIFTTLLLFWVLRRATRTSQ
ncbi:kup [Symbiodinium natans]|uniref:Kup protein n=1 Tax=Symbiodinium natans TaxID=878477 RepID=A0A812SNR0_9DINO|nr:kup [Symbiodinium natans]